MAGGTVSEGKFYSNNVHRLYVGFGTAAVTDSGNEFVVKHKKHHHHNKRGGHPSDITNGNNSTSIKENDA